MPVPPPLPLIGVVDAAERDAVIAAAYQLSDCLGPPAGPGWPVSLQFLEHPAGDLPPAAFTIFSLLSDTLRPDCPVREVEAAWRRRLEAIGPERASTVLLCNVYRYVADPGRRPALSERILRLNLLAVELSREYGIGVVDIDRVFAFFGTAQLRCDFHLQGSIAAEAAGHTIVSCMLGLGLSDTVPAAVQEEARLRHGGLFQVGAAVRRRLEAQGLQQPTAP